MEVIGPTNCRCGAFVTTTIFLYNIFIVRLHLERGMIDSESESESYVAGAHCVLSRHGERFAWVVKREKISPTSSI